MFVKLNGERVRLTLGGWDARKALVSHAENDDDKSIMELVETHGIDEASRLLGKDAEDVKKIFDLASEKAAASRHLDTNNLTIMDLIDGLGYSDSAAAQVLGIEVREVRKQYWIVRRRLNTRRHHEQLVESIPRLSLRDYAAFELVHVLNHSIGRVSRALGLNRGHLCRRLQKVRELLQSRLETDTPPDVKT
jgi:DNA-directed RNA polymerase specialized sigma24 family protein